jgi:hypothetical protein
VGSVATNSELIAEGVRDADGRGSGASFARAPGRVFARAIVWIVRQVIRRVL